MLWELPFIYSQSLSAFVSRKTLSDVTWYLGISERDSIDTVETSQCYKPGLAFFLETQLSTFTNPSLPTCKLIFLSSI